VAIYGSNLSNTTRTWSAANDFTGGTAAGSPLPTSLDGVSVTVNSQPAAVYFVSPGQINFIAPSNLATGAASIVVSNQASNAATYKTTNVGPAAPSFFIYAAGGNYYPAAVRLSDLKTVGDPSVLGGTEKALPGDTIIMFGNGLAPEPGNVVVTPAALNGTISITGTSGSNTFTAASVAAALVYAGEFQINVTLPATLPAGNYTLTMTVPNGSTAGTGLSVILPVGP